VISRNVDVGQTVAASFNTPTLAVIANDLTKMQIDALVSEADIGGVAVDQNVNFTVDAYPYRTFHGKVSQIRYGAITNQNVINYDCVIGVNNSDLKLLPGMTANVSIIIAERDNALKIPNAALRFRPPDMGTSSGRTNMAVPTTGPGARQMAEAGGPPSGLRQGGSGGGAPGGRPGAFGAGGGRNSERGSGGGPGGAGRQPRPERQLVRTVYVLGSAGDSQEKSAPKLTPVQIKVGISDGASTEVLDGIAEGAQIVTAIISSGDSTRAGAPQGNPFGGGFRRF
jgi:HlyD family secretion protein